MAKPVFHATKRDGTPVAKGDRVLMVLDSGEVLCGRVRSVEAPMTFRHLNFRKLQTYRVACDDGMVRPVIANHIRTVFGPRRSRKFTPRRKAA